MLFSSSLGLGLGLDFVFGLLVVMQYAHIFVISAVIVRCPLDWRMVSKTVATGIVIILMLALNCVDHLMNRVVTSSFDFFFFNSQVDWFTKSVSLSVTTSGGQTGGWLDSASCGDFKSEICQKNTESGCTLLDLTVEEDGWNCRRCTFLNHPALDTCECCLFGRSSESSEWLMVSMSLLTSSFLSVAYVLFLDCLILGGKSL